MDPAQLRDPTGGRSAGRLSGLVAPVTGAASGIGAGIAEGHAREGADLALVDLPTEAESLLEDMTVGEGDRVPAVDLRGTSRGVVALTEATAREVARRGVLVDAIAPGPGQPPLLDGETEQWRSAELAELPTGRFADAEIVPTAVLLASEDGSYHVGQTLGPNGGDVML